MKYTTREIPQERKQQIDWVINQLKDSVPEINHMGFVTWALYEQTDKLCKELQSKEKQDDHVYADVSTACSDETLASEP
jgi:predicted regulator of Ras-like GTPase activity (Roadblock/LC7/MglB family)